jgi:hypothetical protein
VHFSINVPVLCTWELSKVKSFSPITQIMDCLSRSASNSSSAAKYL